MNNILVFLKIHLKVQWIFYLIPVLFVYLFLIPYQSQFLNMDLLNQTNLIKVLDSSQKYMLFLTIWYQYLSFRILISAELKEVSYGIHKSTKLTWMISCYIFFLCLFFPYGTWLMKQLIPYGEQAITLMFQSFIMAVFVFFLINLMRSALAGMAIGVCYYFLNINHFLPEFFNIARIGLLPSYYTKEWYFVQGILSILFLLAIILMEKKRYVHR